MPEDPRYRLAYDEAIRSLSGQQQALEGARTRAGTLFAVASVATSFLAGLGLGEGDLNWMAAVALVLYAVVGALTLLIPSCGRSRGGGSTSRPRMLSALSRLTLTFRWTR